VPLHRCPICNKAHEVSEARAEFAYGRQLSCSPECESLRRRRSRAGYGPFCILSDSTHQTPQAAARRQAVS